MVSAHRVLAFVLTSVCVVSAGWGSLLYWRKRQVGAVTSHLLALAQTLLVAQVGLGLLLLSGGYRAANSFHYVYGSLALAASLAPWFYAPSDGPKRLLWFSGMLALAAALAIRALTVAL